MTRVKICGLTRMEDALAAAGHGADALGFVFASSPRQAAPDVVRRIIQALPPFATTVGVFVDSDPEWIAAIREYCGLDAVQLHGRESESLARELGGRIIKAVKVAGGSAVDCSAFPTATLLLDTAHPSLSGGTGRTIDWDAAREAARQRPVILAGGLSPDNVAEAVRAVRPYAVDASSLLEMEPGKKDHDKIRRFIDQAKSAG